jgi:hypothetical protein
MCTNLPPYNYSQSSYDREVKYPYSKLEKHHSRYLNLLYNFFYEMYNFNFHLHCERDYILIRILDVHPSPVYTPSNFDASYKVLNYVSGDYELISEYDIFNTVYSYLPDITPYLEFEFIFCRGVFYEEKEKHHFNLRQLYYDVCSREEIYKKNSHSNNIYSIW